MMRWGPMLRRAVTFGRGQPVPCVPSRLGVAGQPRDGTDDGAGHGLTTRDTTLRSTPNCAPKSGTRKSRAIRMSIPERLQLRQRPGQEIGKQADGDPAAVQRRQWQHVEDRQHDVDE